MTRPAVRFAPPLVLAALIASQAVAQIGKAEVKPIDKEPDPKRIQKLVDELGEKRTAARAHDELLRIGTDAVPYLIKVVIQNDKARNTPHSRRALVVIGRLGPAGIDAWGRLFEAYAVCRDEMYLPLMHALADLVPYSDEQGSPKIVERLIYSNNDMFRKVSRSPNDRQRFQYEYTRFRKRASVDGKRDLKAMIEEVKLNRTHRRAVAAEAIGRMGKEAKPAIQVLADTLRKGAPIIGQIGGFSVPKHRDEFDRAASEAMIKISPHDPRTAIAWGWQLENSENERRRMTAALRLGSFGDGAKEQVKDMIGALRDESPRVRHEVITALGMVGPSAKAAIPKLQELAKSKDKATALRAKAALRLIQKD